MLSKKYSTPQEIWNKWIIKNRSHLATIFMLITIGSIDSNDNAVFCLCCQVWTVTLVTMHLIFDDTKSSHPCRQVRRSLGQRQGGGTLFSLVARQQFIFFFVSIEGFDMFFEREATAVFLERSGTLPKIVQWIDRHWNQPLATSEVSSLRGIQCYYSLSFCILLRNKQTRIPLCDGCVV